MAAIAAIISSLLLVFAAFPQSSYAGMIVGNVAGSTEGLGNFTGNLAYSFTDANNAQLIVPLTNTTPAGGGFITAFAFNNPGGKITGVSLASTSSTFDILLGGVRLQQWG